MVEVILLEDGNGILGWRLGMFVLKLINFEGGLEILVERRKEDLVWEKKVVVNKEIRKWFIYKFVIEFDTWHIKYITY